MSGPKGKGRGGRGGKKTGGGGRGPRGGRGGDPQGQRGSRGQRQRADSAPTPRLETGKEYDLGVVRKDEQGKLFIQTGRGKARVYLNRPPRGHGITPDALVGQRMRVRVTSHSADSSAAGPDKFKYRASIANPEQVAQQIAAEAQGGGTNPDADPDNELPPALAYSKNDLIAADSYSAVGDDVKGTIITPAGLGPNDAAIVRGAKHLIDRNRYPELVCVAHPENSQKNGFNYVFEVKSQHEAKEFRKGGEFRGAKLVRDPKRPGEYTSRVRDKNGQLKSVRVSALSLPVSQADLSSENFAFKIVNDAEPYEALLMNAPTRDIAKPTETVYDPLHYYEDRNLAAAISMMRGLPANEYGTRGNLTFSLAADHLATALTTVAFADPDYEATGPERTQLVHSYFDADVSATGAPFETRIVSEQKGALYAESRVESQMTFMRGAAAAVARLNLLVPAVERVIPAIDAGQLSATGETADQLLLAELSLIQGISEVGAEIVGIGEMMDDGNQTLNAATVDQQILDLNTAITNLEMVVHVSEGLVDLAPEHSLPRDASEVIANPAMLKRIIRALIVHDKATFDKDGADRIDAVVDRLMENVAHAFAGHESEVVHDALGGQSYTAFVEALRAVPGIGDKVDAGVGFMTVLPKGATAGSGDPVLSKNMDQPAAGLATRFEIRRGDSLIDVHTGTQADGSGTNVVYFDTYHNRAQKRKRAAEYRAMLAQPEADRDPAAFAALKAQVEADATHPTSLMVCSADEFMDLVKSGQIQFERDPQEDNELIFRGAIAQATLKDLIAYVQLKPTYPGSLSAIDRANFDYATLRGSASLAEQALLTALSERGMAHIASILGSDWVDYPGVGMAVSSRDTREQGSSIFFFTVDGDKIADTEVELTGDASDEDAIRAVLQKVIEAVPAPEPDEAKEPDSAELDTDEFDTTVKAERTAATELAKKNREKKRELAKDLQSIEDRILAGPDADLASPDPSGMIGEHVKAERALAFYAELLADIEQFIADPLADPADVGILQGSSPGAVGAIDSIRQRVAQLEAEIPDLAVAAANEKLENARPEWQAEFNRLAALLPLIEEMTTGERPFVDMHARYGALADAHEKLGTHIASIRVTNTIDKAEKLLEKGDKAVAAIASILRDPSDSNSLRPLFAVMGAELTAWRASVMQPFADHGRFADPMDFTAEEIQNMEAYAKIMRPVMENGWLPSATIGDCDRIDRLVQARAAAESTTEVRSRELVALWDDIDSTYAQVNAQLVRLETTGELVAGTPLSAEGHRAAYDELRKQYEELAEKMDQYLDARDHADGTNVQRIETAMRPNVAAAIDTCTTEYARLNTEIENGALDAIKREWEIARDRAALYLPILRHLSESGQPFAGLRPRVEHFAKTHADLSADIEAIGGMWTVDAAKKLHARGQRHAKGLAELRSAAGAKGPNSIHDMLVVLPRQLRAWRTEVIAPFSATGRVEPTDYTQEEVDAMEAYANAVRPALAAGILRGFDDAGAIGRIDRLVRDRQTAAERELRTAGAVLSRDNVRGVCSVPNTDIADLLGVSIDGPDNQPFLMSVNPSTTECSIVIGWNDPIVVSLEQAGHLMQAGALEVQFTPPVTILQSYELGPLNRGAFGADTGQYIDHGERLTCNTAVGSLRAGETYIILGVNSADGRYILVPASDFDSRTGIVNDQNGAVLIDATELVAALQPRPDGSAPMLGAEAPAAAQLVAALDRGEPVFEDDIRRRVGMPDLTIAGEPRMRFALTEALPQTGGEDVPAGAWLDVLADGFNDVHQRMTAYVINPDGSRGRQVIIPYPVFARAEAGGNRTSWDTHRDAEVRSLVSAYERTVAIPEPLTREGVARLLLIDGFMVTHQGVVTRPNGIEMSLPQFARGRGREVRRLSSMRVLQDRVQMYFDAPRNPDGSSGGVEVHEMSFDEFQAALERDHDDAGQYSQPSIELDQRMGYWNERRINHVLTESNFTPEYLANNLLYQGQPAEFIAVQVGNQLVLEAQLAGGSTERMTFADFVTALNEPSDTTVTENPQAQRPVDFYSAEWVQSLHGAEYELMMDVLLSSRNIGVGDLEMMYRDDPASPGFVQTELVGPRSVRVSELSATGTVTSSTDVPLREYLSRIANETFLTLAEARDLGISEPTAASGSAPRENGLHPDMVARLRRTLEVPTTPAQRPSMRITAESSVDVGYAVQDVVDRIEAYKVQNQRDRSRRFFVGYLYDDRQQEFTDLQNRAEVVRDSIIDAMDRIEVLHEDLDQYRRDIEQSQRLGTTIPGWIVPTTEAAARLERGITVPGGLTPDGIRQVLDNLPEGDLLNSNPEQAISQLEALLTQLRQTERALENATAQWDAANYMISEGSTENRLTPAVTTQILKGWLNGTPYSRLANDLIVGNGGFRLESRGAVYRIQSVQISGNTIDSVNLVVNNMNYRPPRPERVPLTRMFSSISRDEFTPV